MCVKVELEVSLCNECPFFYEDVDYSVCEDSFDDPNYDFYCTNEDADNCGTDSEKFNNQYGNFIGGSMSRFQRDCEIPDWCPFKKKNNQNQK